ncbi:hybrid sensor histidine kinase/response regulator [uncultured Rhodoblastus sp.]|uniref:hybrid sensor histidine kinase/response regulator n=1 Tax=uncultured Rhodoblastus sp. TaxID=543037 RepID=UPI0025F8B887|nr:hybrid sensor histidine kinase/response regulator [uncultured Rhodoblastus sp.]
MDRPRASIFYLTALAASLLPALLSGYLVWQVRTTDYATGRTTALNMAKLIASNFENTFDQVDAQLVSIGRLYVEGIDGGQDKKSLLASHVERDIADYPFLARLYIADAAGRIRVGGGTFKGGLQGAEISERPYFTRAAEGERGLIFEGPLKAKFGDGWIVVLSRRLENKNGEFVGVAVASIPVESFEQRLSTVDLFLHGVLVFRNAKGVLIARYSLDPSERSPTGDGVISAKLKAILQANPARDHDFYETIAPQDGVERLYAYQRLSRAPFFMLVGQPTDVLDRSWRPLAFEFLLFSLGTILASLWIARRLHTSAVSLIEEKGLLARRVAERTKELELKNRDLVASEALAEAANKAKSEFLATMSHEIRTPLNAIMGTTQLLARSALDAEQKECVRTLDSAGQNMLVLLSDVLDLSKIEAGQLELNISAFDLREVVENVADTFAAPAKSKGLALRVDLPPGELPALVGDVMRLGQVLNNFVGNAIKFTSQGAVVISVETLERSDGALRLRFAVRDSGIGIAPENLGKLFESFVQAERSTYREFGGTGLGLAISKRLIELMGGEVGVTSVLGRGSEFWFVVPFKVAPPAEAPNPRTAVRLPEKQLFGVRILIVDDIVTNRDIVTKLLTSEGAICEAVENGRAAVERLRANPQGFDLVLMDVQMPEMDGLEATRAIRHDLGLSELPVIALTAGAMESQRQQAMAAGMNSFIAKPFRLREMVATLTPWLRHETVSPERH